MSAKLFLLIRSDLPLGDQMAQACHTTAEWCRRWQEGSIEWDNETIVCLKVRDIVHLTFWYTKLNQELYDFTCFCEPDMQGQMTGIACYTQDKIFDKLPLWG